MNPTSTPSFNKSAFFADLNYKPHPGQREVHESQASRRVVACGVRWGKCVRASGEVYDLSTGRRKSVAERGGLTVQSWDDSLRAQRQHAIALPSGIKECVRLCLTSGQELELSTDHPVLTSDGWVEAAHLTPGQLVATPRHVPEPDHPLRVDDAQLVLLAGLIMDGCTIYPTAKYTKMPGPMLEAFTAAVCALGGRVKVVARPGNRALQCSLAGISELVRSLGLTGHSSKTKRLPSDFYGLATDRVGRLLGLLWAGDGWFEPKKACMTLANRLLLEDIRHLLLRVGVHARIRRSNKRCGDKLFDAWTLSVTGSANLAAFVANVTCVPGKERGLEAIAQHSERNYRSDTDLVPIGREEAYAIARETGRTIRYVRDERLHVGGGQLVTRAKFSQACAEMEYGGRYRYLADADVLWSRVRSIDPIGSHEVYDLSVAETHNFACNNIIVHNSLCAAMEAVAAAMDPRARSIGWVVAPTYDLADKIFREMVIIATSKLRHRIVVLKENEKRLVLRNMAGGTSELRGKSADNPVSLLGEGLDWVIVDEAARLKPSIWESHLTQRLIDKRGWALLISTPRGKGWFYELYRRGQGRDSEYQSWNSPSWDNPHLEATVIQAERSRLPERVFRQEFGGEFLEGAGQVFRNVRDCATGKLQEPVPGKRYWAGLDLAKVEDYTVLVVMTVEREVVYVDRFNRVDWEQQVGRIKTATDKYNRAQTFVDSTGAGEPVYEHLRRAGVRAQPYPMSQRSKAAIIDQLAILLEQRSITLPTPQIWPEGIDELEAFEYSVTEQGNVRTGAPSGYHDDCVIALALASWVPGQKRAVKSAVETHAALLQALGRGPSRPVRRVHPDRW